jgi:hypothetical protein
MIAGSSAKQADLSMKKDKSLGVVLFQLGGPDSLTAIEPFLYNLFAILTSLILLPDC